VAGELTLSVVDVLLPGLRVTVEAGNAAAHPAGTTACKLKLDALQIALSLSKIETL